ncbi:ZCHC3 protein, partial [Atractosteus spatula]|nr:ZCHC3 protein [Atractosteus spatula]
NGKRQFLVCFRAKASEAGGAVHPPATISIGPNRGFLHYSGMPAGCWICGEFGHVASKCGAVVCRRCGELGHVVGGCPKRAACNLCGDAGHLPEPIKKTNQRTITVLTYNHYVPTELVTAYLGRYVTVVGRQSGHKENTCDIVRCHNCNKEGHLAKTCWAAKKCDGCGAKGHLLRQCKVSKPLFAQVVEAGRQKPVSTQRERGENKEPAPPPQRTETAKATTPAAPVPQVGRQEDGQNGRPEEGPWITPSKKGKRKREKRGRADPPSEGQKKRVVRENRFLVLEETELSSPEAQEQPEEAAQEMETLSPNAQR